MAQPSPQHSAKPIVLVGLMGAGKTTSGRRLARRLGLRFADADEEIELAANMRIADIFEIYGEAEFREGERKVIERLLEEGPMVLATGGGAFMNENTRTLIKEKAVSVWLKAPLDVLVKRTAKRDTRPILRRGDPATILAKLLAEREPVYALADLVVETDGASHAATVEAMARKLAAHDVH